ncbi:hypothetical protein N7510_011554 [Penicillium lagena]|uniref:uncharacterized protein n=1 Tax=Penicillium lagena TaxID=94218 RepID=UPI00253F6FD7|nr:uncharacterized protein N7510_011554 [Penicillium lagena]KAJ5602020.1 hypothetical protein N7510_011554 [Penicillium lagena]
MIPGVPWIASAVESCLSFYLGLAEQTLVQVSDDGCSLQFTPQGLPHPTLAVIDQWGPSRATLMDAQNQIDATFSQAAVDLALPDVPIRQMQDATKHLIELSDFTIVFVYSAAIPEVYLRVNRFDVHWSEGDIKFVPTKKLRNTSSVKPLLATAYRKCRQALKEARSDQSPTTKSISSQYDQTPRPGLHRDSSPIGGSQQLQSQMPALHNWHALQNTTNTGSPSLNGSTDLLRHLESDPSKSSRNTPQPRSPERTSAAQDSHDANSVANICLNGDSGIQPSQNIELSASQRRQSRTPEVLQSREGSSNPDPQDLAKQVEDSIRSETQAVNNQSTQPQNPQDIQTDENERLSKKRPRESTDESFPSPQTDGLGSNGPNGASPCRKRQCVESEKDSTTPTTETENVQEGRTSAPPHKTQPVTITDDLTPPPKLSSINPWEGFIRISDHDITIPKDQAAFFDENEKLCFIPPKTGEPTPQGHVPPALLQEWNDIARRRHEALAQKEREKTPPLTTQESALSGSESEAESDTSEALSWPESPPLSRHINLIPPESSPIKQPSLSRRPAVSGDEHDSCLSQPAGDNSLDMANACQDASQQELTNTAMSNAPEASTYRDLEETTANPQEPETLEQSAGPARLKSPGAYMEDEIQGQLAHESQKSPKEEIPSPVPVQTPENSSDDESVMDTSFPQALDSSLHTQPFDSQREEDLPSSGPSLSGVTAREHVQVAQTPAAENTRLCRDKLQIEHPPSDSQQPSPQNKTSSQSRIFNTYRSHGSHGMSDTSYETSDPSLRQSGDEPLQADAMGTQTLKSSGDSLSQNTSLPSYPSQTGVVLDPSDPAHRHQTPRLAGPEVQPALISSSIPGASQTSRFSQQTQHSLLMVSSLDTHMMSSQVSPLKQVTSIARVQEQSPSTGSRSSTRGNADFSRVPSGTPNLGVVSRREYFVSNPNRYFDEARNVYEKFRDDYPCYSGDFTHFSDLCAKLQAFRSNGLHLQRSYLWDDFIIGHLEAYPHYIEECLSQGSTIFTYEDFFKDRFSTPRYKKRSLQPRGIEVCAAQSGSITEAADNLTQTEPARQSEAIATSFTGSLVNKLLNFHAHSPFEVALDNDLPDNAFSAAFPAARSSRTSSIKSSSSSVIIKQEGSSSSDDDQSRMTSSPCFLDYEDIKPDPDPAFLDEFLQSNARDGAGLGGDLLVDQGVDVPEVEQPDNDNDVDMRAAENTEFAADAEEEDYDDDDQRHETASIELGDDTDLTVHLSRAESRLLYDTEVADADEEDEGEDSEPENWFHSLRHLRSPGPRWSDDPFTPFKVWARADQNVLVERRRRGGAKILVDGSGVIQRPTLSLNR